jgi:hypothetical protein
MIAVKIDFDEDAFREFSEVLTPLQIQKAINRTTRKTSLWVRTHLLRALGDYDIRRKIVVHRVKVYNKGWRTGADGGTAVKVWFGIDAVEADRIAKPVRMTKGYRVKQWEFPTAFMTKSGRYKGKLYERTTANRLPIIRSKVEIDVPATDAFDVISGKVPDRMRTIALQELSFELKKATGVL